jgi:hypothetical protein
MSTTILPTRTAFAVGVALLQLWLLPASQLLHVGCNHEHPATGMQEAAADSHWDSYLSHQYHEHSPCAPESDKRTERPHDAQDCLVCQVILAARIDGLHFLELPSIALETHFTIVCAPEVCQTHRYCPPGRGPPAC